MTSNEILQNLLDIAQEFATKNDLEMVYLFKNHNGRIVWEIIFKFEFVDDETFYDSSIVLCKTNDEKNKAIMHYNDEINVNCDVKVLNAIGEMLELLDDLGSAYTKEKNAK